jgi:hypothetical protein
MRFTNQGTHQLCKVHEHCTGTLSGLWVCTVHNVNRYWTIQKYDKHSVSIAVALYWHSSLVYRAACFGARSSTGTNTAICQYRYLNCEHYMTLNCQYKLFFIVPTVCVWVPIWSRLCHQTHTRTHRWNELTYSQPHTDTLYNKCKSTFQFSNLANYGHGPPENGFKGDRNM